MMDNPKDLLIQLFIKVQEKKEIDEKVLNFINKYFSGGPEKVLDVIKRGIIKRIYLPSERIAWIAIGDNSEHLLYPKLFCSCQDFYKNVVINRIRPFCKHLIAQVIAEALGQYKTENLSDEDFKEIIKELSLYF